VEKSKSQDIAERIADPEFVSQMKTFDAVWLAQREQNSPDEIPKDVEQWPVTETTEF